MIYVHDARSQLVTAHKIAHELVDISLAENEAQKAHMQANSATHELPQVFVNGKFKGLFEDCEMANEDGQLKQFLSA